MVVIKNIVISTMPLSPTVERRPAISSNTHLQLSPLSPLRGVRVVRVVCKVTLIYSHESPSESGESSFYFLHLSGKVTLMG